MARWSFCAQQGVQIPDGHRFGLHNLRHSLSHWLVNKAKVEPKTVQTILGHSRIQTTLDLYTQGAGDETQAAQGAILRELGIASRRSSAGWIVG
jgi:integrase